MITDGKCPRRKLSDHKPNCFLFRIETLLEEAYNERMHLLTFLKLAEPGWFMKIIILAGQGVFFNSFFLSYLLSPQTCHRFVGYLEEEAVYTYSRIIKEIDAGNLPKWSNPNFAVPDIAVSYWYGTMWSTWSLIMLTHVVQAHAGRQENDA